MTLNFKPLGSKFTSLYRKNDFQKQILPSDHHKRWIQSITTTIIGLCRDEVE